MKIVILAAGKGNRMGELTKDTPKPLLRYKGETLLEHKLKNLPANTEEVILVINYFGEKIKSALGDSYNGIPIKYVEQKEMLGTAHALAQCRDLLTGRFIVLMADDLYFRKDLERLAEIPSGDWGALTFPDKPGVKAGKIVKNADGLFVEIYEDFSGTSDYNLIYTGACILDPEVFKKDMVKIANGEYGLPQTFSQFAKEKNIHVIETYDWVRITKPEDLARSDFSLFDLSEGPFDFENKTSSICDGESDCEKYLDLCRATRHTCLPKHVCGGKIQMVASKKVAI